MIDAIIPPTYTVPNSEDRKDVLRASDAESLRQTVDSFRIVHLSVGSVTDREHHQLRALQAEYAATYSMDPVAS